MHCPFGSEGWPSVYASVPLGALEWGKVAAVAVVTVLRSTLEYYSVLLAATEVEVVEEYLEIGSEDAGEVCNDKEEWRQVCRKIRPVAIVHVSEMVDCKMIAAFDWPEVILLVECC